MQKIKDLTNQTFNNLTAIRYVGKDIAKVIQNNNITYEEYFDLYLTSY